MIALALLGNAPAVSAQDAPLKVSVDGKGYLVSGDLVSAQDSNSPLDALASRKASLAARVLDEQILHSDFAERLFSAPTRAGVMSDSASERLVQSWQRTNAASGADDAALASAKVSFKAWVTRLAGDPREMTLAIARKNYLDGIPAYQENAAIYRSVMVRNEALSYDSALRFLQNQMATRRLAVAVELEKYLRGNAAAGTTADTNQASKLRQQIEGEVLGGIDAKVKSASDLERSYARFAAVAESQLAPLRSYLGTVRPAVIRFTFTDGKGAGVPPASAPGTIVTKFNGQNAVTITVPVIPPKNPPFDITGGILPSPYHRANVPAEAATTRAGGGQTSQANGTPAGANQGGSGGNAGANSGGDLTGVPGGADQKMIADSPAGSLSSNSDRDTGIPGDFDNLKTYSSKPYHSADGMVFNPMNGLWERPGDPADYRIPSVITCCDETGLAFPNEAIEAQQAYWWGDGSGGGTDPNCGRLYDCGPVVDKIVETITATGPTDRDDEILKALAYLDQLPPDVKGPAMARFLNGLPPAYRDRATEILRRFNEGRAASGSRRAPASPDRAYAVGSHYSGRSAGNNSTITGVGGSGGGVHSNYQPVTQAAAQNIVGHYKSIPGGVTLEGGSADLSFIKSVSYLQSANAFLLNGDVVYLNPVSPTDFLEIYRSIADDDKLGVSLTSQSAIVYGKLPPLGNVAGNLELADRFLGDIAFGQHRILKGYVYAPGYSPKPPSRSSNLAVYFNIHDMHFREAPDGRLARSGVSVDTTLVPLSATAGSDGGHLPDLDRVRKNDIPPEYVANLKHLQQNIEYYARERIVRNALAYGEAAAFVRSLKSGGVTFDVASLGGAVPAEKRSEPPPVAATGSEACALAGVHWTSTESIGTREAYRDHLARFPTCPFATLATARIASLDAKVEPPSVDLPKPCGRGLKLNSEGECAREQATRRVVVRRTAPSTATERPSSGGALDCSNPIGLMGCVGHALSKR